MVGGPNVFKAFPLREDALLVWRNGMPSTVGGGRRIRVPRA